MNYLTQDNVIIGFLLFGAVSSIFVILSSICKLCSKLCHGYQSLTSNAENAESNVECDGKDSLNDDDSNRESVEQRNSVEMKEEQHVEDKESNPATNSDTYNHDTWNKIEQLQAQVRNLETKVNLEAKSRRSKSDNVNKYLPYMKPNYFENKQHREEKEEEPIIMKSKSNYGSKIKRRHVIFRYCARIITIDYFVAIQIFRNRRLLQEI